MPILTKAPLFLLRIVYNWFDFQISSIEKSVLLRQVNEMVAYLQLSYPTFEAPGIFSGYIPPQVVSKQELCEGITQLFMETITAPQRDLIAAEYLLPKHYLQKEMEMFLQHVETACSYVTVEPYRLLHANDHERRPR